MNRESCLSLKSVCLLGLTENQVSVLRDLFEGFHLLGNIDWTEGQVSVLRYLFVDFYLLGNIDWTEGQVSVLRDSCVRFPPARRY